MDLPLGIKSFLMCSRFERIQALDRWTYS